jgi:hypothetical protein
MVFCPNPIDWTAVGTCVGATFTGAAAVGTVGTLIYAVRSTNQARKDTDALQRRVADEERRAQARRVSAWLDEAIGTGVVRLANLSDEPVYTVVVYMVYMDGEKPGSGEETEFGLREMLRSLKEMAPGLAEAAATPPAKQLRAVIQTLPHGTHWVALQVQQDYPGLEVAFTDAAGRHWVRRVTGELIERDTNALDHYGIPTPVDYTQLLTGHN